MELINILNTHWHLSEKKANGNSQNQVTLQKVTQTYGFTSNSASQDLQCTIDLNANCNNGHETKIETASAFGNGSTNYPNEFSRDPYNHSFAASSNEFSCVHYQNVPKQNRNLLPDNEIGKTTFITIKILL